MKNASNNAVIVFTRNLQSRMRSGYMSELPARVSHCPSRVIYSQLYASRMIIHRVEPKYPSVALPSTYH